jgi:hypothetical protein
MRIKFGLQNYNIQAHILSLYKGFQNRGEALILRREHLALKILLNCNNSNNSFYFYFVILQAVDERKLRCLDLLNCSH